MSTTICARFAQNAWKKDLCSNCFKSKEEHKAAQKDIRPIRIPVQSPNAAPPKSIIRPKDKKARKGKVTFPKEVAQVIGYGGDWSDLDSDSDTDTAELVPAPTTRKASAEEITKEIDELEQELDKLTKVNTNFNTANANLLGDPETNIRRSFAAMQLGVSKDQPDAKKQTLKISVMPFGGPVTTNKVNDIKQRFSAVDETTTPKPPVVLKTIIKTSGVEYVEEAKPAVAEKSLMDEISETLERKSKEQQEQQNRIKLESQTKRPIARHTPIVKDQAKPKISVFHKNSDTDSNQSDTENGSSGYYDVVEASSRYENLTDTYPAKDVDVQLEIRNKNAESSFFSNHLISEMFSSNKDRKNNYSFRSEITSDGLIVTKASSSDDAMDSTGSSFDYATSSDEELSSMNRSESDSGIGICVTSSPPVEKLAQSNVYEDVQVQDKPVSKLYSKSRELAGEPDGSADPDGSEAPALPSSPPPNTTEPRQSFLHQAATPKPEKPAVPVKPTVSIIKAFVKRSANQADMISELQSKIKGDKPVLNLKQESIELTKGVLKKSRAPDPPSPSTEEAPSPHYENVTTPKEEPTTPSNMNMFEINLNPIASPSKAKTDDQYSFLYTRNPTGSVSKSTSPVIREKDKRERATINPKFRSLNTFSSQYKAQAAAAEKARSTTPEPAPRKSLSLSQECLDDKKKKPKFSIKKFLRINTGGSKTSDTVFDKKEGIYGKRSSIADDDVDGTPQVKPRLVIIHPIDINNMEVEVVKEMGKVNEIVTGKPPAPPLRKGLDASCVKPNRPPPPKSAEVRRKLKLDVVVSPGGTLKSKEDSVYANLGEIRSAIAPRKPERTASMREREAQLELAKKRLSKFEDNEDDDADYAAELLLSPGPSTPSTLDRADLRSAGSESTKQPSVNKSSVLGVGIKSSIQKMNNTIDSYLKDKLTETTVASTTVVVTKPQPPATPQRSVSSLMGSSGNLSTIDRTTSGLTHTRHSEVELRGTYEPIVVHSQRSSLPDNSAVGYQQLLGSPALARAGYCKSDMGAAAGRFQSQSMANIARAASRSYCNSEISDLDIYSPYSFYGGSEIGTSDVVTGVGDDTAWGGHHQQNKQRTTNRLRMRKGRSVVHKTLEDNYGAVVVANHEALAQVLDQLQKTTTISPSLRPLANSINLRFDDFTILEGVRGVVAGRRAFHPAIWANQTHVTLALSVDCQQMTDLSAITEFCDLVPSHYLPLMPTPEQRLVQATISVLPRMFVDTLQSFGQMLRIRAENLHKHQAFGGSTMNLATEQHLSSPLRSGQSVQNLSTFQEHAELDTAAGSVPHQIPGMPSFDDLMCREVGFVLLQLVNGLKHLQSKGIEELPLSLSNVILCRDLENKEAQAKLFVLHGLNQDASRDDEEPTGTLCQCAHSALTSLLPSTKLTATLTKILVRDRSESLTKTKSVLEFALWGPVDVALNGSGRERELALQRWLDLERATVLHGLIRSRVELSAYDECHLMFLVRSSAKTMCEASAILSGIADSDIERI